MKEKNKGLFQEREIKDTYSVQETDGTKFNL